ncbi:MAG: sulfatase-like hydrolase/transferase [Lentimonas sp.]
MTLPLKHALTCLSLALCLTGISTAQPNIVLIFVDDLGFSDLGSYGSEIDTPNLDSLAAEGLRFNNFRVTPMCVTSRISMFSGMDYHRAGRSNIPQGLNFAYLLRDAGYQTSWVGKNHGLEGMVIGDPTTDFGFDHFYGFYGGATNNFLGDSDWKEDNVTIPMPFPVDFYSTNAITDKAIEYIGNAITATEPFFSYVAYNAPHGPLQAPQADVEKYLTGTHAGTYANGWEPLQQSRFAALKTMGMIDESTVLAPAGIEVPVWENLPQSGTHAWELNKDFEELTMAAYAAMVDSIDQNVGRIIAKLKDPNGDEDEADSVLDDTLILFLSDNGGVYAGAYKNQSNLPWDRAQTGINTGFGWGMLMNTPFRYYKHSSHGGGIRSPFIAHWPNGITVPDNSILGQSFNILDIYPTLLDLAGATYPATYDPDGNAGTNNSLTPKSLEGESIVPIFTNATSTAGSDTSITTYQRSNGYYEDGWKIVHYTDGPWELYNVDEDPTERFDLSNVYPAKYQDLIGKWTAYRAISPFPNSTWVTPAQDKHRGWGFDRIRPGMLSTVPAYMSAGVPIDTDLSFEIDGTVDFNGTANKFIRLQRYGSSDIIWEADPLPSHASQGGTTITFTDLPILESNTHYYVTWDLGWFKYDGTNVGAVQEAAFAFRFKTAANYEGTLGANSALTAGSTVAIGDDIDGDGIPELAGYMLAAGEDNGATRFDIIFDETTDPATPVLQFQSRNNLSSGKLVIEHTDDLAAGFTPVYEIDGATAAIQNAAVVSASKREFADIIDYTLRLDTAEVNADQNFFRTVATQTTGEVPLAIWVFNKDSLEPVQVSPLVTASAATFDGGNSGIIPINEVDGLTLPTPVLAWSGDELPQTALGIQVQTAVTAVAAVEVTKIVYTGYAWSTRAAGTAITISADIAAWLDGSLDSPGIRAARSEIINVNGENTLKPFSITYDFTAHTSGSRSRILSVGQEWDLRARLQDADATVYDIDDEGFGISTVTVYGIEQ